MIFKKSNGSKKWLKFIIKIVIQKFENFGKIIVRIFLKKMINYLIKTGHFEYKIIKNAGFVVKNTTLFKK